ncbi:MAG: hypothetical protein RMJ98_17110, partial [Myxococcales bacterium]|nr:hypothetical protein [Polyangiaceae bacterium]MDW8251016.1 hypothetical protein [Myxococcales bacterium]
GVCAAPTCSDTVKNGSETDVDCGGPICPKCGLGKNCDGNGDCISNQCVGGKCVADTGCSDGQREGYFGSANIAACSGGWTVAGVTTPASMLPQCNRNAGDDSNNPLGTGCSVADLCQVGWHVCASFAEVADKSGGLNCNGSFSNPSNNTDTALFFATRQSGPGTGQCGVGNNDLFGCGTIGATPNSNCNPLDRFSHDLCSAINVSLGSPWSCGNNGLQEAANVTKLAATRGGVLCCRD